VKSYSASGLLVELVAPGFFRGRGCCRVDEVTPRELGNPPTKARAAPLLTDDRRLLAELQATSFHVQALQC
jgi:hypothetical protein